jgi:cytochrome oxidase Cu insertion factor (SCO1/SenC/PrrC family)
MKALILAAATLFSVATSTAVHAQNAEKLKPGDILPGAAISMKNANGKNMSMKDANGKNGLLVMFSCNTCPFVVRNQSTTTKTIEYAKGQGIGVVVINSNEAKRGSDDSYDAMKKYAKEQSYTAPYLIDEESKLADMFGANHTPEIFLFNKDGKLMYKGAMNDNPGEPAAAKRMYIEEAINAMVAGKAIDPSTTKSVGCSIKRKA